MKRAMQLIPVLLAVAVFGCGCELVGTQTDVKLSLPPLPAWLTAQSADVGYQIEWLDIDGRLQRRSLASGERQTVVRLPKLPNTVVLVYAVIPGSGAAMQYRLLPGGALFPHHLSGSGRLEISWQAGAAAWVMRRIAAATGTPERYNAARLHRELLARSDGDPWSVDLEALIEQLLAGSFRATAIRTAARFDVEIAAPEGTWYSENLLRAPHESQLLEGRPLLAVSLQQGLHRFFHASGDWVLNVVVEDGGTARWTFVRRL